MKKVAAAVVVVLLAPMLALVAIALAIQGSQAASTPCASASSGPDDARSRPSVAAEPRGVGCADGTSAPSATPVSGASVGCALSDPSGAGGCVTPAMAGVLAQVKQRFGPLPVSCWSARGGDPYSDHPKGRACDYTMGRIGIYPGPSDVSRGWALASWLRANAVPLRVNYVIWQGRIWSRAHDGEGWRLYTGGGHYSAAGPTNGHYDHVHVSTLD